MILVIDVGNAIVEKNKINNTLEMVLEIALDDNLSTPEIQTLLNKNLKENDNKITKEENKITIISTTYVKGIFSNLFGFRGFYIKSSYVGVKENNKNVISKKK